MSVNLEKNNRKFSSNSQAKAPIYSSPFITKKRSFENLYNNPMKNQVKSLSSSKHKLKQKITAPQTYKNIVNIQSQKINSDVNGKIQSNRHVPQSYKKLNSKLYLKKNLIKNISGLKASKGIFEANSNKRINVTNNNNDTYKNRGNSLKFNINSNNNFTSLKDINNLINKSTSELVGKKNLKKARTKSKNMLDVHDINSLGYILNTQGNKMTPLLTPQNLSGQKNFFGSSKSKDGLKKIHGQSGKNNKSEIKNVNRNNCKNIKSFPISFLNKEMSYKTENNIISSSNGSSLYTNSITIKANEDKRRINVNKNMRKNDLEQTAEEIHFLIVNTIQNGQKILSQIDTNKL